MLCDSRKAAQGVMNMFGADANTGLIVGCQRLCVNWRQLLLFVSGANDSITANSGSQKHDGIDRPVIFSISVVVCRSAPHFALHHYNKLFPNL